MAAVFQMHLLTATPSTLAVITMKYFAPILAIIVGFTSCKPQNNLKAIYNPFKVGKISIRTDTTVKSIAYLNDYLICLQDNDMIIVFDTSYNRCLNLEKKLNKTKIENLITYRDSVFISSKSKLYILSHDFSLIAKNPKETFFPEALYDDSVYMAYGCCVGEFGGSVFFLNKQTQKTYSYMATCATQVLKFKETYSSVTIWPI